MHPITEELEFDESELFADSGKQDQHHGHESDNDGLSSSDIEGDDVTRSRLQEPGGWALDRASFASAINWFVLVLAWMLFGPCSLQGPGDGALQAENGAYRCLVPVAHTYTLPPLAGNDLESSAKSSTLHVSLAHEVDEDDVFSGEQPAGIASRRRGIAMSLPAQSHIRMVSLARRCSPFIHWFHYVDHMVG